MKDLRQEIKIHFIMLRNNNMQSSYHKNSAAWDHLRKLFMECASFEQKKTYKDYMEANMIYHATQFMLRVCKENFQN